MQIGTKVFTAVNLFSSLNAGLLGSDKEKYLVSDIQPLPINRYTQYQLDHLGRSYSWLSFILGFLRQSEILIEMLASKWSGEEGRWRAVTLVEAIK